MSSLTRTFVLAGALLGLVALAGCGDENTGWNNPGVKVGTMIKFPTPWDSITANTNQNLTLKLSMAVTQKAYIDIQISEADSSVVSTRLAGEPGQLRDNRRQFGHHGRQHLRQDGCRRETGDR